MRNRDGLPVVDAGDYQLGLAPGQWEREQRLAKWERKNGLAPPKLRRKRNPSIPRMIAAAEKTGKTVTSVTHPDGTVLHFGELAPTQASTPWPLTDFTKVTRQ